MVLKIGPRTDINLEAFQDWSIAHARLDADRDELSADNGVLAAPPRDEWVTPIFEKALEVLVTRHVQTIVPLLSWNFESSHNSGISEFGFARCKTRINIFSLRFSSMSKCPDRNDSHALALCGNAE